MLSRTRFVFLVLGVSACAGSTDITPGSGTGGNQSGTAGSTGSGTAGNSASGSAGSAGTTAGGGGGPGAGGVAGSATGSAGSVTTGTAGSSAGTAGTSGGGSPGTAGTSATAGTSGGAAGRGGTTGTAGTGSGTAGRGGTTGAAGRGGTTGSAGTSGAAGTFGAGGGPTLIWPNDTSKANSDPWLSQNHDRIAQLQPRVLVIDLENTANGAALVDRHIAALRESTSFHKYKDASAQPAVVYQSIGIVQAPKGTGTSISYTSWNTQAFADSNLKIKDPADPNGPNLTLCGLFEKGVINEVWCMASQDPKCGETQEAKQKYNADDTKSTGFVAASNGANINNLNCKVTIRITDFNSGRGTGCHQHAMGHAWERYMDAGAIPGLKKQAARFLNWDLNTRVGAPFSNFYSACTSNGSQLTNCMVWQSNIHMVSGATAASIFDIADMSGGCGNAHFYANTTGTYSYDANTPDNMVLSSCENYGLHNGTGGKDLTTPYTNAMTDTLYGRSPNAINGACPAGATPACSDDCGGHGTAYLYQNFPGPGTKSTNDDGTPMRNWWVYLFY